MSGDDKKGRPPGAATEDPWAKWRQPAADKAETRGAARAKPVSPSPPAPLPRGERGDHGQPSSPQIPAKPAPSPLMGEGWGEGGKRSDLNQNKPAEPTPRPRPSGTLSPLKKAAPVRRTAAKGAAKPVSAKPVAVAPSAPATAQSGVRLSKVMSERGLCSRREADLWIERGWVFVDGVQVAELGSRIDPAASIAIAREAERDQAKQVTILLHKPVGYVSGQPEPDCKPAVALISTETWVRQAGDPEFKPWMLRGLAPAGRLDIDSTGLLVLTQDGRVARKLVGEDSETEKEYLVRVSGELIANGLELLRHGLKLDGKLLKPAWVKQLNEDQLHFILKEGKKRQIRRMCEQVGLRVTGLKRVRIGKVRLGDLPLGQWRFLRADERF